MSTAPQYNLTDLSCLQHVANADAIVERIDLSAHKAAVFFRLFGIALNGIDSPTVDQVDRHLRLLVSEAVDEYFQMRQASEEVLGEEVESANAGDDLFEILVYPVSNDALHIEILMSLC